MNSLRVSELAKELNMTSKEVIEKFAEISIMVKSHSNTVMPDQIRKLKEHLGLAPKKTSAKKAFVVKKAKSPSEEPEVVKTEPKEPAKVERIERVKRVENAAPKIEIVEKTPVQEKAPVEEVKVEKKTEKPIVRVERTKIEYPKNQSRIEIVRKAPPKGGNNEDKSRAKDSKSSERGERKPFNKPQSGEKKLVERRIIPQEIYEGKGQSKKKVDNRKKDKDFNSKKEDQEMISLEKAAAQKHKKRSHKEEEKEAVTSIVVNQPMTIQELADKIQKTPAEIVRFLMFQGVMATVNQLIDVDTIKKVCAEYELEVLEEDIEAFMEEELEKEQKQKALTEVDKKLLKKRAPVVSIMGHVDHGKTSLLDAIRKTNVIEGEAGGITQHIGAYKVNVKDREITFLDTPGHEAFTSMRARGAQITDIAILVVAANDGVMPQTIEAINHAKAAEIPIIVAVNKMDLPGANIQKVKEEITEYGLVPEEWGGDTIFVPISAKKGEGIDNLLEMVLLQADMLELKVNPKKQAKGAIIEAKLDKSKGPVATMLVQRGQLDVGDTIVVGSSIGRIRTMTNDKGKKVKFAGPSTPVEITGLTTVPNAGETFYEVKDEKTAKHLIERRRIQEREKGLNASSMVTLDDLFNQIEQGKLKQLNLIVKADVQGSVEAVKQSLEKLSNDEVRVKVIHSNVGGVTETDVTLAKVSNAIIIAFNVRPEPIAKMEAEKEGVEIKMYSIIYNAIEDVEAAMKGMLDPEFKEVIIGNAEVRQTFKVSNVGTIAGCYVTDGKIARNSIVRVIRDNVVLHEGKLISLKRFKDDAKEVAYGYECGVQIENYNDVQEGDIIEAHIMEEIKR